MAFQPGMLGKRFGQRVAIRPLRMGACLAFQPGMLGKRFRLRVAARPLRMGACLAVGFELLLNGKPTRVAQEPLRVGALGFPARHAWKAVRPAGCRSTTSDGGMLGCWL